VIHPNEPRKRELIHGVNVGQLRDGEEENGGMDSHWTIAISGLEKALTSNLNRLFYFSIVLKEFYFQIRLGWSSVSIII
jgi:hypothetical protein